MSKAHAQGWLARLLQGASLASLGFLGYQLGVPSPPVAVEVRGADLVARVPGQEGAPEVTLGEARHPFQRAPTPGEWILRGALVSTPQEVVVHASGAAVHLGGLQAEPPPVRILGPAPGPQLEVLVARGVTVWWDQAPERRYHLPPGRHTIPAPPAGANTWTLGYRSAYESGEAAFDARTMLQEWATQASNFPDAGTHLARTGLFAEKARSLLRDPAPRDRYQGWTEELLRVARDPFEVRLIFNRQSDLLALEGRQHRTLPCDASQDPRIRRSATRPDLVNPTVLERNRADGAYSDLVNDMVIVRVVPPAGRRIHLRDLVWPISPPGRGPLAVTVRIRNSEDLWVRMWEFRMGGNGYRVHFPPRHCDGPPREWLVWEIPPGDTPEPGNILQLEVWNPESTGVPEGFQVGDLEVGRLGE
jgi:hypothetical protein